MYGDSECLLPTHPFLGTYLRMFSKKTREETKKGELQAKKGGTCAKKKKKKSIAGRKLHKVQNINQSKLSREKTPRKNKSFLKLTLTPLSKLKHLKNLIKGDNIH